MSEKAGSELAKGLSIASFVVSILGVIVSVGVARWTVHAEYQSQRELLAEERAQELRQAGIDFNVYAGLYVASVMDDQGRGEATTELVNNLRRQHTALTVAMTSFEPQLRSAADSYRTAIERLAKEVEADPDLVDMRPFWQASADMLKARDTFYDALDRKFSRSS